MLMLSLRSASVRLSHESIVLSNTTLLVRSVFVRSFFMTLLDINNKDFIYYFIIYLS